MIENKQDYPVSKGWDMDISFDELVSYNKDCRIQRNIKHNFEGYNGILLYLYHPHNKEKYSIELGIAEDGFVYEGDYGSSDKDEVLPIKEGLKELMKLRSKAISDSFIGRQVRNKRDGILGVILRITESGSIQVIENVAPVVINTHDSWNTLEVV